MKENVKGIIKYKCHVMNNRERYDSNYKDEQS